MMLDFNAGKYAVFVWPAYAATAVVFLALIADTLARARRWRQAAKRDDVRATLEEGDDGE